MPPVVASEWDEFLERINSRHSAAHLLQTTAWGELKAAFGWEVGRVVAANSVGAEAGAQILFRRVLPGFTMAYIPKGPVGEDFSDLWPEIDLICRQKKATFLKVEPDLWESTTPAVAGVPAGFRLSPHSIQPPRTLVVDLRGEEEQILARMKQKTRYNVRLALKKGVIVRPWMDMQSFHQLLQVTGDRDAFGVHSLAYYQRAHDLFYPRGESELLLAEFEHEPLAALMVFAHGQRAWYFFGASSSRHRDRMPTYLLQWEAMRWARAHGCSEYDLWGVPDADEDTLEASFTSRSDGLWGVYRFKRGFGGELRRSAGPWDRVYRPGRYGLYRLWLGRRGR